MRATVAVVGGGYGGTAVASALDGTADVVLVGGGEAFVHNVAALRALVDPGWTDRIFLPYDHLLSHGRVVRDTAVHVDATGTVTLASGERVSADYTVLATGSSYPFPAKTDSGEDTATAKARFRTTRAALTGADSVLLLGAGPVGLELAGEIKAVWPGKSVTLVDPGDRLLPGLPGLPDALREAVHRELDELGVRLLLGTTLAEEPPSEPGEVKSFHATTRDGRETDADIWFRCHGVVPATGYLADDLAAARQPDGHLRVTPELRLPGSPNIFAVGDITAVPEAKTAKAAGEHAKVVAANITALAERGPDAELTVHEPGAPSIALPVGPERGASYAPGMGLLDAETTAGIKGRDLMLAPYLEMFGRA